MYRYQLAPGVFVAATDDGAVLLDLERDDYLGLDADQSRALADIVEGWATVDRDQGAGEPHRPFTSPAFDAMELARALAEHGVLVERRVEHGGGEAVPSSLTHPRVVPEAICELVPWEHARDSRVRFTQVVVFLACL